MGKIKRTTVKTIIYRIIKIVVDLLVMFALTGNIIMAGAFTVVTEVVGTLLYWLYEYLWSRRDECVKK